MKREAWRSEQSEMPFGKLVFIDQTGINTGMTRLYGRASSDQRVVDYTPDIRFERTTVLSSIRASGEMVPLIFEAADKIILFMIKKFKWLLRLIPVQK